MNAHPHRHPPFFLLSGVDIICRFVYVYKRLKGLFVFPLVALWLVPFSNMFEVLLSPARQFFFSSFFFCELLNHVNLPSPEFQTQAVEKLAIASAWQVGSISVLSVLRSMSVQRSRGGPRLALRLSVPGSWGVRPMFQTGGATVKSKVAAQWVDPQRHCKYIYL